MYRRMLAILLVVVGLDSSKIAAQTDPFLGIWEANAAKSSPTRGAIARSESLTFVPEPGGVKSTLVTINPDRGGVEVHHFIFDGNPHKTEGGDQREMSAKRTGPRRIDVTIIRDGKATATRSFEVSADGKTLTVIGNGTTGSGTPYANDTRVYDKQY